jgi:tRNA_anti-like
MWMVNFDGSWQPAENDEVVVEWIRQGLIGPQTSVRHSSWPNPMPLEQVPEFGHLLRPRASSAAAPQGRAKRRPPQQTPQVAAPTTTTDPKVLALAWGMGMFVAFWLVRAVASTWILLGILTVVLGVAPISASVAARVLGKPPAFIVWLGGLFVRRPVLVNCWAAVLILGGGLGLSRSHARGAECRQHVEFFTSIKQEQSTIPQAKEDQTLARWASEAEAGHQACLEAGQDADAADMLSLSGEIDKQREALGAAERRAAQAAQAEAQRVAVVKREAEAVATFPSRSEGIVNVLKAAAVEAAQSKWEEAGVDLDRAQHILDEFRETSVASSKDWADLAAKIANQRKRIQPQLDRINAQKAQAAEDKANGVVPIGVLLGEYKDNEVRADARFKGNMVQVTGIVGDVKKDILNSTYVTVGTGAFLEFPTVQCFVKDSMIGRAASLSKGDHVTVRGRVSGLMMNVLVKDCEIAL